LKNVFPLGSDFDYGFYNALFPLLYSDEPQALMPKRWGVKGYRYKPTGDEGFRAALAFTPKTVEGCLYDRIRESGQLTKEFVESIPKTGAVALENINYPPKYLLFMSLNWKAGLRQGHQVVAISSPNSCSSLESWLLGQLSGTNLELIVRLSQNGYHDDVRARGKCPMRTIAFTVVLVGCVLVFHTALSFASGEACTLITQAQVSAALEISVGPGTPIASPSTCQWTGKGRFATLTVTQPLAGKSALDRFNAGKALRMPGITTEPISGVGDEAYYVYFSNTNRAGLGLVVKKGASAFEIRVYGLDLDKAKSVAKTLCQTVAGNI
jgi:hypothetical protein